MGNMWNDTSAEELGVSRARAQSFKLFVPFRSVQSDLSSLITQEAIPREVVKYRATLAKDYSSWLYSELLADPS